MPQFTFSYETNDGVARDLRVTYSHDGNIDIKSVEDEDGTECFDLLPPHLQAQIEEACREDVSKRN